jgi:hypothetical protein
MQERTRGGAIYLKVARKLSKTDIHFIWMCNLCIMTITPSKSFAIYQTQKGIELLTNQANPTDAKLICIVSHYQSAVRIARKAAQIRQEPLVTSGS